MSDSIAGKEELILLSDTIKKMTPSKPSDVRKILDEYFKEVHFSLLKAEWDVMTALEKRSLCGKLYRAYSKGQLPLTMDTLR